jgi:hypothetical protein
MNDPVASKNYHGRSLKPPRKPENAPFDLVQIFAPFLELQTR